MKKKLFNHYHPGAGRAAWAAGIAAVVLTLSGTATRAAESLARPFTPGNLIVEKMGDGTSALSSAGTPILFDEITPSGTVVQSFGIPNDGTNQLVDSGVASSDGGMTLSADGKSIVFPGYYTNLGVASVASTTAAATPRGIGQIDAYGNYTLPATSTLAFSGNNIRGAATDGNGNYWGSGTGSTTNYGIYYFGTNSAAADLYSANIRSIGIFGGNIYYSTASSTGVSYGIAEFSGEPVASATPTRVVPLVSSNGIYNFSISPAGTTLYYADDGDESAGAAGIVKYTYSGGVWSKAYYVCTNASFGLAVNWATTPATIYATTGSGVASNSVIQVVDNGAGSTATVLLTTGTANEMYRGISFVPTNTAAVAAAPVITGISPTNTIVSPGTNVYFTIFGTAGVPAATNQWYVKTGTSTTAIAGATNAILTLTNVVASNTASYFAVARNASGSVTSSLAVLLVTSKPTITGITPASVSTSAGSTVTYTLTSTPGTPAATNLWYKITGTTTNLISGQTNTTLTLSNVLHSDSASYFAILTNSSGSATSSVVTLTVTNDPNILNGPANAFGLIGGTVQFNVSVAATSPSYYWYFSDTNGNIIAPVASGTQASGSVVSGIGTSTLTIANLQSSDPTNFVVVVSNAYGSATSSVASLLSVGNNAVLTFWNFNQTNFSANVASPAPWFGVGTASYFNCFIESGAVDPYDATGGFSYIPNSGLGASNFSWASYNYPLNNTNNPLLASNKQCGVQFLVSTAGARNIMLTYQSRVTQTASYYYRLQYTINGGTAWTDYPASTSFNGNDSAIGTGWFPFTYDFTGFPGVDNNPNFGVRIVSEFQSTASYGVSANSNYEGAGPPEPYGFGGTTYSAGTVTYDLVSFSGDAITNSAPAPVISAMTNLSSLDYVPVTNYFTVTDSTTSPDLLNYSAVALDAPYDTVYGVTFGVGFSPFGVSGSFTFGGSGPNRYVIFNPSTIPDEVDAAPILVTVTDPNTGASAASSFIVTLSSVNLSPTNSLTSLPRTNLLVNSSLTIPFSVSDDRTPPSGLTYDVASDNNTLIPAANIVIGNQGTANPTVTITPAAYQLGTAVVTVGVEDNDSQEPRTNFATFAVTVRPNTNVVAIDYFNYDNSGPLETVGTNLWSHLSGNAFTMLYTSVNDPNYVNDFGGGYVTLNPNVTENLQAPLIGAPYLTTSTNVLYMSFLLNMQVGNLPIINGTYFITFNDGTGSTADINCKVIAATNGAAAGHYRLGVGSVATTATNDQMFPLDLVPGTNYTVVASEVLATGQSTLWINPSSPASPSVTDTTSVGTNLFNLSQVFLRQSGGNFGGIRLQNLKVGTTFDAVVPSLHLNVVGTNAILTSSDPTLGIQAATNVLGTFTDVSPYTPYTNSITTNSAMYYRFGR